MRKVLIALALAASTTAVVAQDRATFLAGQYATAEQCEKLRKIEAGTPKNVSSAPELLDADGFHGWETDCRFTKVFEHEPGRSWAAIMICSDGMTATPGLYAFMKDAAEDRFEVSHSDDNEPATYTRCDAKKGN